VIQTQTVSDVAVAYFVRDPMSVLHAAWPVTYYPIPMAVLGELPDPTRRRVAGIDLDIAFPLAPVVARQEAPRLTLEDPPSAFVSLGEVSTVTTATMAAPPFDLF
jgi:hypothetical protein